MTGPEHYRQAERILDVLRIAVDAIGDDALLLTQAAPNTQALALMALAHSNLAMATAAAAREPS